MQYDKLASIVIATLLLASVNAVVSPVQRVNADTPIPPPSGMVGWWTGDGNTNDLVGGNHGTLQNGATFAAGKVDQAFSFDGIDDRVAIPDSSDWNFGTGDFTIDFWEKSDSAGSQRMHALSFRPNYGVVNLEFNFDDPEGLPEFGGQPSGLWVYWQSGGANRITVAPKGAFTDNNWHHIALTRQGTTFTLYIDGALRGTTSYSGAINLSGSSLNSIGADGNGGAPWKGLIDEVEIFNRALSQSEIQSIVNAGSAGKIKPDVDGDGVGDGTDNCPTVANSDQADADSDGTGNVCDLTPNGDDDTDGVDNLADNCPSISNTDQLDTDGDGAGDVCDPTPNGDDDGDGIDNAVDNCVSTYNPDQADADSDGIGDACDAFPNDPDNDIDDDGIGADTDNCPAVANADQLDTDGDGLGDVCDPTPTGDDTDGDGIVNNLDACPTVSAIVDGIDRDANDDGCLDTTEELLSEIQAANIHKGIKKSLIAKVKDAIESYNEGDNEEGNEELGAFIKEVKAQKGKKIPSDLADLFIGKATNIIALHPETEEDDDDDEKDDGDDKEDDD